MYHVHGAHHFQYWHDMHDTAICIYSISCALYLRYAWSEPFTCTCLWPLASRATEYIQTAGGSYCAPNEWYTVIDEFYLYNVNLHGDVWYQLILFFLIGYLQTIYVSNRLGQFIINLLLCPWWFLLKMLLLLLYNI